MLLSLEKEKERLAIQAHAPSSSPCLKLFLLKLFDFIEKSTQKRVGSRALKNLYIPTIFPKIIVAPHHPLSGLLNADP